MRRILAVAALAAAGVLLAPPGAAQASCYLSDQSTGANYGILNGTQVNVPIDSVVSVTGLALGLLGSAHAHGTTTDTDICYY
jgi:hypothetical protein